MTEQGESLFGVFPTGADVPLDPWPATSERFEDGAVAEGRVMFRTPDGTRASGVWRCTPGRVSGTFITDEVSAIMAGRMTVEVLGSGDVFEVQAGDVLTISEGAEVVWTIHETLTKAFTVYRAGGLPF